MARNKKQELIELDEEFEPLQKWAESHEDEAEQLARDCVRLLACTSERLESIRNQGFFKRCWNRLSGKTGEMERANTNDLIELQQIAFRYIEWLYERQDHMAHCLISLKNHVSSLVVRMSSLAVGLKETKDMVVRLAEETGKSVEKLECRVDNLAEETGKSFEKLECRVDNLAEDTREHFEELENLLQESVGRLENLLQESVGRLESRLDQLEISKQLHEWLLGLGQRHYDERLPGEHLRLFRVINDFYAIKNDAWTYNELLLMSEALEKVKLDPRKKLSLKTFIDSLVDEIQSADFPQFQEAICQHQPEGFRDSAIEGFSDYSDFVIKEISSPVFAGLHLLKMRFLDRQDDANELGKGLKISPAQAIKRLLRRDLASLNMNLDYEYSLEDIAVEILGSLRLAKNLAAQQPPPRAALRAELTATQKELQTQVENLNATQKELQTKRNNFNTAYQALKETCYDFSYVLELPATYYKGNMARPFIEIKQQYQESMDRRLKAIKLLHEGPRPKVKLIHRGITLVKMLIFITVIVIIIKLYFFIKSFMNI